MAGWLLVHSLLPFLTKVRTALIPTLIALALHAATREGRGYFEDAGPFLIAVALPMLAVSWTLEHIVFPREDRQRTALVATTSLGVGLGLMVVMAFFETFGEGAMWAFILGTFVASGALLWAARDPLHAKPSPSPP